MRQIKVKNYDELRDALAGSGLFDMTDCAVEIWCPESSEVADVQRMTTLIESMVHVTDIKVGSSVENLVSDDYIIVLTEDNKPNFRKRFTKGK